MFTNRWRRLKKKGPGKNKDRNFQGVHPDFLSEAYEQFTVRMLRRRETLAVYMATLQKLARLFG